MTDKKPKVKIFNTFLAELQRKYTEMYSEDQVAEEDYTFVTETLQPVKYNKNIVNLLDTFAEEDVLSRDPEIFPQEDVFWNYFPKMYSLGYKNKEGTRKFMEKFKNANDMGSSASELESEPEQTGSSVTLPGLPNLDMSQIQKLMSNPKFMNLANKLTEEIEKDPELINNIGGLLKKGK